MRDSLIFYRSFYEAVRELPKEQQWEIYNAIFSYWLDFKEEELSWISKSIFTLIKPQLDANIRKYKNWKKDKKWSKTEAKVKQKWSKAQGNVNVNVNVNDNVKEEKTEEKCLEKESNFSKQLEGCVQEMKEHRRQIKSTRTDKAEKMFRTKISKYEESDAIQMINDAIENWRKTVYEQNWIQKMKTYKNELEEFNDYMNTNRTKQLKTRWGLEKFFKIKKEWLRSDLINKF